MRSVLRGKEDGDITDFCFLILNGPFRDVVLLYWFPDHQASPLPVDHIDQSSLIGCVVAGRTQTVTRLLLSLVTAQSVHAEHQFSDTQMMFSLTRCAGVT